MSTSHRGLPPPSAMALPVPSSSSNLSQLPDRWPHGNDETQRSWLQAKAEEERRRQEEERRRQEEERTRQENFRLEIRRTELEMLREAFRGGMPPQLVPVIFTGGGALAGTSAEWAHHYIAQLNQNQQHMIQGNLVSPPESRLEGRLLTATEHQTPQSTSISTISRTPAQHSANQTPHIVGSVSSRNVATQPIPPPSTSAQQGYSPYNIAGMSPNRPHAQHIHHTEAPQPSLPRINTDEMQVRPPPQGPPSGLHMQLSGVPSHVSNVSHHALHQGVQSHPPPPPPPQPETARQPESSPIFFHHWQPPATHSTNSTPVASTSPAASKNHDSPYGTNNYLPGSNGNKRRGPNTAHNRHRSDSTSNRGYEPYAKSAATRPRRADGGSNFGDSNGGSGQFSISHMTANDSSPEMLHRDSPHKYRRGSQEPQITNTHYPAGSDIKREHHAHQEREGSISQPRS